MMPLLGIRGLRTEVKNQKSKYRLSILCLLTISFLAGCAPKVAIIDEGLQFPEEKEIKVERIDFKRIEDGDVVTIKASKPLSYAAFKLTAPLRLIIDIPDIDPKMYKEPIEIKDGIISNIKTDLYKEKSGAIGRIEIGMEEGVEYELEPEGNTLIVKFKKEEKPGIVLAAKTKPSPSLLNAAGKEKNKVKRVKVEKIEEDIQEKPTSPEKKVVPENTNEKPPGKILTGKEKAEKLLSIDIEQGENDYIKAVLRGDGFIENYDSFRLDEPERVVIDLWNIESVITEDTFPLASPYIDMIRVGSHSDRTRVVFDLKGAQALSYSVERRKKDILIVFQKKDKTTVGHERLDSTEETSPIVSSPQIVQEASIQVQAFEKEHIEIKGVEFEDNDTSSKLVITASDKIEYDLAKSFDGKTVALIIKEASLPDHLQRTLDTSELNSPVALVSSYRSGSEDDEKIMVVVRLKEKSIHKVTHEGTILKIDFPKTGVKKIIEAAEDVTVSPPEPEKVAMAAVEPKPIDGEVAQTEVIKEDVKPPTKEAVKVTKHDEVPPEPEKATVSKKQEVKPKPSPEPEKIAAASIKSEPVKKEDKEEDKSTKPVAPKKKTVKKVTKKPKKVKKAVAPEVVASEKQYTGRRMSLDFKDADITNILRLIAEVSKLNIVTGDDVKGKVSLRLVNVPWDQVLEIILKTNDLGMIREGNVLRIAPIQKIAKEKERLLTDKKAEEKLEDLIVRLIPVNYAIAGSLQDKVKALLSERGNVSVDSRTNTLIVKDIKDGIEEAEVLVKKLDTPTPQVLIEARIVEASATFARDLGIEWGIDTAAIANNAQMDLFGNLTTSGLTPPSGQGGTNNFAVSLPASGSAGPLGAMGFTFGKLGGSSLTLDLRLSAGEVGGLSKIVSRPRIVTLDNKQAKISQGKTIPYQTVSDGTVQTQFFDATLDLTVTPHITPDGSVMLKIKASKNSKGEDTAAGPVILKKEASTEILLKDGDTTVIGGIVESNESDSGSGVPMLQDIPVLGWLFKRQSISNDQTELLIFITPTILNEEGALSN